MRKNLIAIGIDTVEIIKNGFYFINDKMVKLPNEDFEQVTVYSPQKLNNILNNIDVKNIQDNNVKFNVIDSDSFDATLNYENCLVLNFASATTPGGGFLSGARAQEETLCRKSTLYKSISSFNAREMYNYNILHRELECYSDYMLLSKNVCVFKNSQYELYEKPYLTSVLTCPAPNRNGLAINIEESELEKIVKQRMRYMFSVAHVNKYKTLILGAWGCGAFRNSAKDFARYFYEILCVEKYAFLFDNIVFAMYKNDEKMAIFKEIFL